MYRCDPQLGSDGDLHSIDETTRISAEAGLSLYELCKSRDARATLEVGMAYGFSTLYFLAAGCTHTAIDPFELTRWHGIAIANARKLGVPLEFIAESSFNALAQLAASNRKFDVILIDGNHRFDDVLVDFTLSALLCDIGSVILLDDLWMPSISLVREFIRENRKDFLELTSHQRFALFQKLQEDGRSWDHFSDFIPPQGSRRLLKKLAANLSRKVFPR